MILKTPEKCPVCNDVLRYEFGGKNLFLLQKLCDKKLDHKIIFIPSELTADEVKIIKIPLTTSVSVEWHLYNEIFFVWNDTSRIATKLPFFKPDLNDYKKLINKVKTYILFS